MTLVRASWIEALRNRDRRWARRQRPGHRRILVNARTPMNHAVLAPIIDRLRRDARVEIFLTSSEAPGALETIYAEAQPPFRFIRPATTAFLRFDAYLAPDFLWMPLPRGSMRIQTFHGVAGKYRTIYDSPTQSAAGWDRLFFINRHRLQRFIASGSISPESDAIRLIGMPKVDCLVDGSLRRDEILVSLGIDPSRRTVLYAPTWSPYSSLPVMGEEIVQRLGAAGFAVIAKLHDRSRDPRTVNSGGVDWASRLEPIVRKTGGRLATGADSSRYLAAADVLVSVHSSVAFEYLLLDRPVIRVELPDLIARTDIEPSYVELLASASTSVRDAGEMEGAVQHAFADPGRNGAERRAVAEGMFYRPGTATSRAVREIYDAIELEPTST